MTYNTEHYVALMNRLTNEKARLESCTKPKEIELRKVWVSGVEKEIASEVEFLKSKGIEVYATIDDLFMSDDELMNELLSDSVAVAPQEVVVEEVKVLETTTITKEQAIITTRQWFADNAQACIDEAVSGQVRVNNLTSYIADQTQCIQDSLSGKWDHTLAFQQRVLYVQTGKCYPILP